MPSVDEILRKIPLSRGALAAGLALLFLLMITYQISSPSRRESADELTGGAASHERKKKVEASLSSLTIGDAGLLRCIVETAEDRANLPANIPGSITDVRQLEMLYCRDRNITSLKGLGELTNLHYLDITKNGVRSLAPLAGHPRLRTLYVSDNPLDNLRVVKSMRSLKTLKLPDFQDQECLAIGKLVKGLKTNYFSIACEGPKRENQTTNMTRKGKKSATPEDGDDETLTDSQQRELFEFEREMRYSK